MASSRAVGALCLMAAAVGLVLLARSTGTGPAELSSHQPPKVLPVDGDYPGGTTGIPQDGYWPLDTSHGVLPYFSDPSVVYNSNSIDFPLGDFANNRRMGGLVRRGQQLLATAERRRAAAAARPQLAEGGGDAELGNSWAQPVAQGYVGEPYVDYPYMENGGTGDVLETEESPVSEQARYPYLQNYGQAVDFIHGNELDKTFYNYDDGWEANEFDNTAEGYSSFLGLRAVPPVRRA